MSKLPLKPLDRLSTCYLPITMTRSTPPARNPKNTHYIDSDKQAENQNKVHGVMDRRVNQVVGGDRFLQVYHFRDQRPYPHAHHNLKNGKLRIRPQLRAPVCTYGVKEADQIDPVFVFGIHEFLQEVHFSAPSQSDGKLKIMSVSAGLDTGERHGRRRRDNIICHPCVFVYTERLASTFSINTLLPSFIDRSG